VQNTLLDGMNIVQLTDQQPVVISNINNAVLKDIKTDIKINNPVMILDNCSSIMVK